MQQQGGPRSRRSFPDSSRSFAALQAIAHRPTFGPGVWHTELEQALGGSHSSSPRLLSTPSLGSSHSSPRRAATARQSSLRVMLQQVHAAGPRVDPRILTSLLGWSQAGLQCLIFPFLIAPCVCRLEACSSVSATFGIK